VVIDLFPDLIVDISGYRCQEADGVAAGSFRTVGRTGSAVLRTSVRRT
jgi:hypothetical protein